ncbi:hypothetical protein SAMD00023353_5400620 [Rosellinia necatrix]|uniref:Shugoshin n=1 Tax=Rosellinia necatrix TaxID=77044 RepID=A0A1W2TR85_ROSNE|nr:hypothetical protein SAMD00023353_5400620 [Rosellinia necatrix]
MARLNEPTVSTDSLEILRRKFLRQNRDIARTNSTQSLKIRNLENECARLLSENLQLRSEVLRLKTELEGSHAQRVADHALQIKERMEAQLVEWGTMLASLGHEPVPKNRSPRALKRARLQRSSIGGTRLSDWRRRETIGSMQDLEAAALQEGRLPPLWENKTYPRETMNQDEILALCSEAEESTDSPDLGPPPVSRFIDEDPVKLDLCTLTRMLKPALSESDNSGAEDVCEKITSYPSSPSPPTNVNQMSGKQPDGPRALSVGDSAKNAVEPEPRTTVQTAKINLKRKVREEDEKENVPLPRAPLQITGGVAKDQLEKGKSEPANLASRPLKQLPMSKRDARDKSSNTAQRKPLGAKSSNGALSASKKHAKPLAEEKGAMPEVESKNNEPAKGHVNVEKEPKSIEIAPPSPPETVSRVDIEPEGLSAEPSQPIPDSPEMSAPRGEMNDTPPPFDISSRGETTRANRRARAAVSYAEPNLRDKMRRPNTKQIFDAVAGDGKNIRRTSQCQRDELASGPSSMPRSGAQTESSRKDASSQHIFKDAYQDTDIMASPSVQKTTRLSALEELPASVTTDRKRKDLITPQVHKTDEATTKLIAKSAHRRLGQVAAQEAEIAKTSDESDVYEFTDTSHSSLKDASEESTPEKKNKITRQSRARRLSSVTREDLQPDDTEPTKKLPGRPLGSRKRASMAAVKSTQANLENSRSESPSVDGDSVSTMEGESTTREKAASSRRRTTML